MKPYLLDVNLLVALSWPAHEHHDAAQRWFRAHVADGFATCPFTQAGLVRILSNPAVVPGAVSPTVAARLLDRITALPGHQFWPNDILVSKAVLAYPGLTGHKQVMDAYLVEQTRKHGGGFATLDHGVSRLSRPEEPGLIEVVAPR